jgi:hypothetical protein
MYCDFCLEFITKYEKCLLCRYYYNNDTKYYLCDNCFKDHLNYHSDLELSTTIQHKKTLNLLKKKCIIL